MIEIKEPNLDLNENYKQFLKKQIKLINNRIDYLSKRINTYKIQKQTIEKELNKKGE